MQENILEQWCKDAWKEMAIKARASANPRDEILIRLELDEKMNERMKIPLSIQEMVVLMKYKMELLKRMQICCDEMEAETFELKEIFGENV